MKDTCISKDMPLVTFVMPCYNSASFMSRAVDSLLEANHPCEILLINDGSTDDTSKVAHAYAAQHDSIRVVDQENSNWGGVVNHGIELARGRYFKILDSDDYFEPEALHKTLDELAQSVENGDAPDLLVTDYLYDHIPSGSMRLMRYNMFLPTGRTFTWSEIGRQPLTDNFLMIHASWYSTATLRESGVHLPTGISYTDSLLLLHPLAYVKRLRYLNVAPYCYVIGREGQSTEIEVIKKHIDEQLLATRLAIEDADYAVLYETEPKRGDVMTGYMKCMMSISTVHLLLINTPEADKKRADLWRFLKERNPALYKRLRWSWGGLSNCKTRLGRAFVLTVFIGVQRRYRIN